MMVELVVNFAVSVGLAFFIGKVFVIEETTLLIIWLVIFNVIIGYSMTYYLGKLFFEPITKLSNGMKEVSKGNFDISLEADTPFRR